MVPPDQLERPRVTEISVRMDCNGCVQKIKKALYGINGIYDLYIDFPQQKLTIIGWADPEKVMRAIRKTRKVATLCSHTEQQPPPAEESEQPPPQGDQPPPSEPNQGAPPESAAAPPPEQGPPPEAPPPPTDTMPPPEHRHHHHHHPDHPRSQATQQVMPPRDVGEVHHVIHHHGPPPPPDRHFGYGYRTYSNNSYWNKYSNSSPQYQVEMAQPDPPQAPTPVPAPAPVHVATTHSYNMHRPSSNVTEYYHQGNQRGEHYDQRYARASPPRPVQQPPSYSYGPRSGMSGYYTERYSNYDDQEPSSSQYYYSNNGNSGSYNNGNFTSIFSDENPNACRIV